MARLSFRAALQAALARWPGSRTGKSAKLPRWPVELPRSTAGLAALCFLLMALLPLFHQATTLGMATSLRTAASSNLVRDFLMLAGVDPVYASVFNRTMGNIEAQGLAIGGPLGTILHQAAPQLFAPPEKVVPGAWVTALVGDGVSVLASALAKIGTNSAFMVGGLVLLAFGMRRGGAKQRLPLLALVFLSAALQARGLAGLIRHTFTPEDLEIMGISHIFTKLFPINAETYRELVSGPFHSFAPYLIPSTVIFGIYGATLAVLLMRSKWTGNGNAKLRLMARRALDSPLLRPARGFGYQPLAAVAILAAAITSPVILPSRADYDFPVEEPGVYAEAAEESPVSALEPAPNDKQTPAQGPSKVVISGSRNSYSYKVDGRQETIRGMGYNTMYSHLSLKDRAARYDWDFFQMKAAGINTVLGWEREQFDELTLQKAQEYGLGVVLPYHLPGNGDYGNPVYEEKLERDVKEWVKRFKSYPALRMWGLGNEVIHYINNPSAPRARHFAQFYVKLADAVRAVDPDHPVIYRDAEDRYVGPIRDAFQKGGAPRPWFVYGVNFFTYRICEALANWPKTGMDSPLVVSEFAPSGLSLEDRPKGYLRMWKCIASQYPSTLGGFIYVWTTNGPEAIDRTMGITDVDGLPVDRSLWAMGRAFHRHGDSASQRDTNTLP